MNVVSVKFGGVLGGVDRHKISFSLRAWFSCVEQKDRQEGLFLGCYRIARCIVVTVLHILKSRIESVPLRTNRVT